MYYTGFPEERNMKKIIAVLCCAIAVCMGFSCFAEAEETWQLNYYVDEFKLPTDDAYITTAAPIAGTFCNSAVDDERLNVSILIDEFGVSFVLYEYGDNKVKNSFSSKCAYDVTMLDDAKQKTHFTGGMIASGGDRIEFTAKDSETIMEALLENAALSFYIAEQENPTTNYLFTIADTDGFAEVFNQLKNSVNEADYQRAVSLYNSGKYTDALDIFATIIGYKDSIEWLPKYQAMLEGEADTLMAEGKYDEANKKLQQLYEDTGKKDRLGEPWYVYGETLMSEADYNGAITAFTNAGSYSDSATRIKEAWYAIAEEKLAAEDYEGANNAFTTAGDYSDAASRVGEPYYTQGEKLVEALDYEGAISAFENAGSYSDAASRVKECWYTVAEAKLTAGEYAAANDAFIAAGDYGDAAQRVGEPYYTQAEALLAAENYEGANTAFKNAGSYSDAASRVGEPYYTLGQKMLEEKDYIAANEAFASAGTYSDAANMAKEALYILGTEQLENGHYGEAVTTYQKIEDYKDVPDLLDNNANLADAAKRLAFSTVGNTVTFGEYEQDNDESNGKEPLEWIVLNADDDKALLLTKYALDYRQMNSQRKDSTWKNSELRKWLNEEFYQAAFDSEEQWHVFETPLATYSGYSIEPSEVPEETLDYVFLLSFDEVETLFEAGEGRFEISAYAREKSTDIKKAFIINGMSWLRTPETNEADNSRYFAFGELTEEGKWSGSVNWCEHYEFIRPAIFVDLYSFGLLDAADRKPYPTLQQGDKNDDVKKLQQALIDAGALTGKADGDYGKKTATAVAQMQETYGMEATGIADDAFQLKLFGK